MTNVRIMPKQESQDSKVENMDKKRFKVASVSTNKNSFGLTGVILVAEDGQGFEVGSNDLNLPRQGEILSVPLVENCCMWGNLGFEIPRELEIKAPPEVVKELWG